MLVFDISTYKLSNSFLFAGDNLRARLKHAPKMLAASTFDAETGKFADYLPHQADELIKALQAARTLLSFNGKKFDLLVLRKHHSLRGRTPARGAHIDLGELVLR